MKKKTKITDVNQYIKTQNEGIPEIQTESDEQPNNNRHDPTNEYAIYNSLDDAETVLIHLRSLFPNKTEYELQTTIKNCDTFDAMINSLTVSSSVILKPHMVREDLSQRDIPRSVDYSVEFYPKDDSEKKLKNKPRKEPEIFYQYNYPEIFGEKNRINLTKEQILKKYGLEDTETIISDLRSQALEKNKKQAEIHAKLSQKSLISSFLSDQSTEISESRTKINKICVLLILSRNELNNKFIDLHGLYAYEVKDVLDDWLHWRGKYHQITHVMRTGIHNENKKTFEMFRKEKKQIELKICTGTHYKAYSIRPEVLKYFTNKNYMVQEEGACIVVQYYE